MEYRLYILAGTFVLVLVSLVVLVIVLGRARKVAKMPPQPDVMSQWPMLKPAPQEIEARIRETFSEPTTGVAAVLNEPIRTGVWQPDPVSEEAPTPSRSDYWDSLIDEPALRMRDRARAVEDGPKPVPQAAIVESSVDTPSTVEAKPEPITVPVTTSADEAPSDEVVPAVAEKPVQDAEIDHLIEELDVQSGLGSTATAEEPIAPTPPTAPTPPSVPTPPPTPVSPPETTVQPKPIPAIPAAPTTKPVTDVQATPELPTQPAGEQRPESTTPVRSVDEPVTTSPSAPPVTQEPAPPAQPESLPAQPVIPESPPAVKESAPVEPTSPPASAPPRAVPAAQMARVTTAAGQTPPVQARQVPSARRQSVVGERPKATAAGSSSENTPEHVLVAPVEMWFGDDRVGVRPGSRTYDLFQKYARVLLDDLRRSGTSTPV